ISAWLKYYYPTEFTAALLNSQPMGFYAPAQLVRDLQDHGIEVRPVDVNESAWDCTLEPITQPSLAPKVRDVKAQGAALGECAIGTQAPKGRDRHDSDDFAPSGLESLAGGGFAGV